MKVYQGTPASRGTAIGPVYQYRTPVLQVPHYKIENPGEEMKRLADALQTARVQLEAVYAKACKEVGEEKAAIFQAQLEMLDDPDLLEAIENRVQEHSLNVEAALEDSAAAFATTLEEMGNEYFRERAADVRDMSNRVMQILTGFDKKAYTTLTTPSIIIAYDLAPSDTIHFDKTRVLGFAIAQGGPLSHTAILARTLGLPAVVGAHEDVLGIANGQEIVLDGESGTIYPEPDQDFLQSYKERQAKEQDQKAHLIRLAHQPAVTRDGHTVEVVANIGSVTEAKQSIEYGAEGVGLLRTEFLYLQRTDLPDEEEQYQAYREILDVYGDLPVVLRTLDVGGDKDLPYMDITQELNPFLGVRAIRLCLQRPDLFRPQMRAALRAGAGHNLKIMFPMIATLQEMRAGKAVLETCWQELKNEGHALPEKLEVGIMVEIPSAVIMADVLVQEADFFSIGTNDLTQYVMAADRTNPGVSSLTSSFAPPVLRMIDRAIQVAHQHGKWVGLCGELAGEPLAIPILLGLGLDEFSMNAPAIPAAKEMIRSLDKKWCEQLAQEAMKLSDAQDVQNLVRKSISM